MTERQDKPRERSEPVDLGRRKPGPTRHYPDTWQPKFVIEIWAHPRFRERDPNRPLTFWEALEVGYQTKPDQQAEPDPEPEAEP